MTARITGQADICREQARRCKELADDPTYDGVTRSDLLAIADRWRALAESYDLAIEFSGYLEWQSKRIAPPPDFALTG